MKKTIVSLLFLMIFLTGLSYAVEEARLMRFPAVYENRVAFSYAGDLYLVELHEGKGVARKLTSHVGYEIFPRFSPDGKSIAFTAQYDGNREVYRMDAEGGVPVRLTYTPSLDRDDVSDRMGPNNIVMGWKHDNKHIVFRSRIGLQNTFVGKLYLTHTDGRLHRELPLPSGGFCSYSDDDSRLAYNRVFREFRTWKRYRGGMADDIRIYDFKTKTTQNITNNPALDLFPMWKGEHIYFLSDRGPYERMNLYVYSLATKETKRLTHFREFDIKFPSLGKESIAFENGGYIYLYNTRTQKQAKLEIHIKDDRIHARDRIENVKKHIHSYNISPDGKRALFNARGEVFTVPAKHGNTRNITRTPGIRERNPVWSPDGRWIAFISDRDGEDEIYIQKQDGASEPVQLTSGSDTYKFDIKWSPDSKKIAWADRKLRTRYIDIQSKQVKTVDTAPTFISGITWYTSLRGQDFNWSPDSKWLAFTRIEKNQLGKIHLYSLEQDRSYPVTGDWHHSFRPVFSPCGKYLYFVSGRDFNPLEGTLAIEFTFSDMERIYLATLSKSTPSPFKPKSDEVAVALSAPTPRKKGKKSRDAAKKSSSPGVPAVKVDPEGIAGRIVALPVPAANYSSLVPVKDKIYYLTTSAKSPKTQLMMFDLDKQKQTPLGQIHGYAVSADLKKMLASNAGSYAILPLPTAPFKLETPLNLDHLDMHLRPKEEWKNIYYDGWRQMRDFFYAANMHGVGWEKMKKRYEPLLSHVNHRNDLTYIIGELFGELNVGHAYVGGGERPEVKRVPVGLLGAEIERDAKSGYFRLLSILEGANWNKALVSPLTAIGVDARAGDYIIAVNGQSTAKMNNPYKALINTVGKQVRLSLNAAPTAKGAREVTIVPIADDSQLYYHRWVRKNIETVTKATAGKVGYVHIPDMGYTGLVEFVKYIYPQLAKKALIIDVRGNGGGYVSEWVLAKLQKQMQMIDVSRHTYSVANPSGSGIGPKVCLIDEYSASDGDIFPYRFKTMKMGKVIGKRTWGGVVGINASFPAMDGGTFALPEYASYDLEGKKWVIEGHGVEPDIEVDNDPAKEYAGIDQQLNKAIEVILKDLKTKEKKLPPPPAEPDKSVKSLK